MSIKTVLIASALVASLAAPALAAGIGNSKQDFESDQRFYEHHNEPANVTVGTHGSAAVVMTSAHKLPWNSAQAPSSVNPNYSE